MTTFVLNSNKDMYNVVMNPTTDDKWAYIIINTKNKIICNFTAHDKVDGVAYANYAISVYESITYNNYDNKFAIKIMEQEYIDDKLVRNIYNYKSDEWSKAVQRIIDIAVSNKFPIVTLDSGDGSE